MEMDHAWLTSEVLDHIDGDMLLSAIEGSQSVRTRPHFYLWAQGVLQGVLPHRVLLVAMGRLRSGQERHVEAVGEGVPEGRLLDAAWGANAMDDVLSALIQAWDRGGRIAMGYGAERQPHFGRTAHGDLWASLNLGEVIIHGCPGLYNDISTLVCFGGLARPATRLDLRMAGAMVPFIREAMTRCHVGASQGDGTPPPVVLSIREQEILTWLQRGKTNQEIGRILEISALTVKNHVQRILRKLNVHNRAEAAAHGAVMAFSNQSGGKPGQGT
jgi:transcriptional regulator EpsA